ncbi:MAG: epoxyqueuosine reductase QueH [Lachnospiraceae bacterium]|nr:epoxyqueuosine reductase QueH [Lachnospiraceae bacterium]
MNHRNFQKELDRLLSKEDTLGKHLLLHSCCAPCSSYCLEYLSRYFTITVFYYNPNISLEEEYRYRVSEMERLLEETKEQRHYPVDFVEGRYDPKEFFELAKGMEELPEGGKRCYYCYEQRMRESVEYAAKIGADYYTTTLSISPYKNAKWINEIGERLAAEYGVTHLPSDFKKKNGYKRSIELSKEYDLYRQDYCGCIYSKLERERQQEQSGK